MKILIACEFSGKVRDNFIERGHDAISCDLLPTETPGPHIQGDVIPLLKKDWDLIVAHPPCTYLANSGVRWLYSQDGRWGKMREAADFFRKFLEVDTKVAVENPVMHYHAQIRKPDFTVQPWMFGDNESKRTCFWVKSLPHLKPWVTEEPIGVRQSMWKLPPSKDRQKLRSITFDGIAKAIAEQWG